MVILYIFVEYVMISVHGFLLKREIFEYFGYVHLTHRECPAIIKAINVGRYFVMEEKVIIKMHFFFLIPVKTELVTV